MNLDERLEKLRECHEELPQNLQSLAEMQRSNKERFAQSREPSTKFSEPERFAEIDRRLDELMAEIKDR